jgi:hypothetical protein
MSTQYDFYAARAAQARADAERTGLENVRDRCLRAAAAWDGMADRVKRTAAFRAEHEAAKASAIGR